MPDWKQYVREHLPSLQLAPKREAEIVAELAQHLEAAYEEALAQGSNEAEARAAAAGVFKDWRVLESELHRAERIVAPSVQKSVQKKVGEWERKAYKQQKGTGKMLADLVQDIRYGMRTLRKNPGFTAVAILTLALGIGANTAIFSVVNGVLLKPLPYSDPERLALIRIDAEGQSKIASISAPELVDFREQSQLFEGFAGVWASTIPLTFDDGEMEQIQYAWATDNLFPLLGAHLILGRHFMAEEEKPDGPAVALLSYELWQRRFGGDPDIVGKPIRLNDRDRTIVGVLPSGFRLLMGSGTRVKPGIAAWVPQNYWVNRNLRWLRVIGRLKPGVSFEQAQADMDAIARRLQSEYPEYASMEVRFHVLPLHGDLVREVRSAILTLMGAVGLVLLIACANVASLLLVRLKGREKEIALRSALGASRGRILLQIVTENLLLAILGGAAGLLVARWGVDVLLWLRPANLPRMQDIEMDPGVLGFSLLLSVGTGLLFGIFPAFSASKPNLNETLKEGGRSGGGAGSRVRGTLVAAQVALSLVLLVGAGLMIQTFIRLQQVDPGFNPSHVLTVKAAVSPQRVQSLEEGADFFLQLKERLDAHPAIVVSGATSHLPLTGSFFTGPYAYDPATEESWGTIAADYVNVIPGYFEALGIPLLSGRDFETGDQDNDRVVVLVDELIAQRAWPGQSPAGKRILITRRPGVGDELKEWADVIGITRHSRRYDLRSEGRPQIYFPLWDRPITAVTLVVRTTGAPMKVLPIIRREVEEMGAGRPVHTVRTMESYLYDAQAQGRFALVLMGALAGLAFALSVVGLYGAVAYSVSQRTREFGIRLALGAGKAQLLGMVLKEGLVLSGWGIAAGVAGALFLTRFLSRLLFEVNPADPLTFFVTALLLLVTTVLACYLPARRAAKVDPMVALRYE